MTPSVDILIVDDDLDLARLVAHFLEKANYAPRVANTGETAWHSFVTKHPDLIILDISLADANGLELCRRFRAEADVPVIFLTVHADEVDELMGFASGADDFVAKPVSERVLLARIEAVLRRRSFVGRPDSILHVGALVLNPVERTVTLDGEPVELTHLEFEFLHLLMESPRQVFTRAFITEHVWGSTWVDNHAIDVLVSRLRTKFTQRGGPNVVEAVRGVGYRLGKSMA